MAVIRDVLDAIMHRRSSALPDSDFFSVVTSFRRTPAEISAAVTPVNFSYAPGYPERYGAVLDGVTDDTAALINWAKVPGLHQWTQQKTAIISAQIPLVSNSIYNLHQGTIQFATTNISGLFLNSVNNVVIRGGTIQQTAAGSNAHVGLIRLVGSTNCRIENMELIGHQWCGIVLDGLGCNNNVIRGCYAHNGLGNGSDTDRADFSIYGLADSNIISECICQGGPNIEHGVAVIDPGSSAFPTRNLIIGNRISKGLSASGHRSYGVVVYSITHGDTFNTVSNNSIQDVTGLGQSGNAGMGIYIQGMGGSKVIGNLIRNCATNNTVISLPVGGIGLNLVSTLMPVDVVGNSIYDQVQGAGIHVVSGPANIVGNTIRLSSAVQGNALPYGIYINAASNVNVQGNHINMDTSITNAEGIFCWGNGTSVSNINISNNLIDSYYNRGIRVDNSSSSFTETSVTISGNNITGGTGNGIPIQCFSVSLMSITGNICSATTLQALDINACANTRIANNLFATTGSLAVNIAGTCTGSYYDKSNTASTGIKNAATGMICEQLGSAVPGAGFNSAVGDRVEQSVPVVGNPKGWRCTVAGNPGTWVSEGNL